MSPISHSKPFDAKCYQPEHLSGNRPIILDETYESPETAAFHEEGYEGALVPRADSPSDLISMSAYGKSQPPNLHGQFALLCLENFILIGLLLTVWIAFDATRTFPESPFPFATPSYGTQAPAPVSTAAPVYQTAQMTQMAFPPTQGRLSYNDQSGPYLNVGSTPVPGVSSYSPSRGSRGTRFSVSITSLYELQTTNTPMFFLQFGRQRCAATLSKVGQQGAVCSYVVTTEAPQFASTAWNAANVPVSLLMTGDGDDLIAKVDVGGFTYVDGGVGVGSSDSTQEMSRKRKMSPESDIKR